MRLNGGVWKAGSLLCALLLVLLADPAAAWDPRSLLAPCHGDCGASIYGGWYVENSMGQVLVTAPEAPLTWNYQGDDHIIATAISRRTASSVSAASAATKAAWAASPPIRRNAQAA